ncbi:unnamed protein product [Ostreobium quekettii]|uniref:C2 domain-containing protein n=1 Tax=Ostreobium quekettii TaxID=121088 RepID=A0A8S1JC54_9CHLO|nr:unnamed protein product [Ostreobium quekettii]|eukprot:evm.model.scf_192EXC.8 EVM.evm.TU.scf_192EXC.8   scf_192EXC:97315-101028(-)
MSGDGVYVYFQAKSPMGMRDPKKVAKLGPSETYVFDTGIKAIGAIFGWEAPGFDLDAAAAIFDEKKQCLDFVWWDHTNNATSSIGFLTADNQLAGAHAGDKEALKIDFTRVPHNVTHILLVASVYTKDAMLDKVKSVSVRLSDGPSELCTYTVASDLEGTSMLMGVLLRNGPYWSFVTMKQPVLARTVTEIMYDASNLVAVKALDGTALHHFKLALAIRKARNLTNMDTELFGNKKSCNPYMVITHGGKRHASEVVTNSYSPEFEMEPVDLGEAKPNDGSVIEVQCYHHEEEREDEWLGVVKVCVGGLTAKGPGTHAVWLPLSCTKERKASGTVITGTVQLEVTLTDT